MTNHVQGILGLAAPDLDRAHTVPHTVDPWCPTGDGHVGDAHVALVAAAQLEDLAAAALWKL